MVAALLQSPGSFTCSLANRGPGPWRRSQKQQVHPILDSPFGGCRGQMLGEGSAPGGGTLLKAG